MTKLACSCCCVAAGYGILWTSTTAAVRSAMRSTEANNHGYGLATMAYVTANFFVPFGSVMVVHPLLVYKSSAMVLPKFHHQLLSLSKTRSSQSLPLAYPATILRVLIRSLLFVEMISKSFVALIFLFAFTSSVNAQVCMEPALGVSGTPTAQDVRKPTDALPCGGVNIAQNLESSTPIQADKDGKFSPSIISFAA